MFASLVQRVMAPFRRKHCPECGHKVREQTFCDVCGYQLIDQTRDKMFRSRLAGLRTSAAAVTAGRGLVVRIASCPRARATWRQNDRGAGPLAITA